MSPRPRPLPRPRRTAATLAAVVLLALPLAACGGSDSGSSSSKKLVVLSASSLTEVFDGLEKPFEAAHQGVTVEPQFGSSTDLAAQAADDAPGDVLATADQKSMQSAQAAKVTVGTPIPFATNKLVIVTAPGNPKHIASLADLAKVVWVRCADDAPCGRVALTLLQADKVTAQPKSLEEDVKSTLDKVTSGEADAGLVYASDALASGNSVTVVPIAGSEAALTTYYIAPLKQTKDATLAADWVALVTSSQGQAALTKAGFTLP